ncbi:MAG: ATP-binding protein [Symploca sp. SIO1B1]|nr:ATP-binding protein [Symploca sp. SIO1B1]
MMSNPFNVGQPISSLDKFVGRTSEIDRAFDQILNYSNLAVWGGHKIGKSSFLEQLASPQVWRIRGYEPSQAVIVLFSCLSIDPFTAASFWREVLKQIKDKSDSLPTVQSKIDTLLKQGEATKDSLREVLSMLGEENKFLVLLVDDYDAAFYPNKQYTKADIEVFLSECRSVAYHASEKQYLSMVVASLRRLNELGPKVTRNASPWYNHYLFQPLKPFEETEVTSLMSHLPMTTELRKGIREITGNHPALLQIAGFLLYRDLKAGKVPNVETFTQDFQTATIPFFQISWDLSNEVEQTLLMLIALLGLNGRVPGKIYDLGDIHIIFSQKELELMDLENRGLIMPTVEAGKKGYSFASSLMEWWVIKEIEKSNEESLQQRQKGFLHLMSHKQAEQVTNSIHLLWKHKEVVPSALAWISRITALFSAL